MTTNHFYSKILFLRITLLLLFISTFNLQLSAQLSLDWAFGLENINNNSASRFTSITIDNTNHIICTGFFTNGTDLDPSNNNYIVTNSVDIMLAKYDDNNNFIWGFNLGNNDIVTILTVKTDNQNNIYVSGSFHGTIDFDPSANTNTLISNGDDDGFIAKYDINGNYLWAISFGGNDTDDVQDMAVTPQGDIYVTGGFHGTNVDFDPSSGTNYLSSSPSSNSSDDCFIAKYNTNGNHQWAFSIGGSDNDRGDAIDFDNTGHIYVTGHFVGNNTDFNPNPTLSNTLNGNNPLNLFVSKYTTNGDYEWAFNLGGTSSVGNYTKDIMADNLGHIYVAGRFHGTADFDADPINTNMMTATSLDPFVAKYDDDGTHQWAFKISPTSGHCEITTIKTDNNGSIIIAGEMQGSNIDFDPSSNTNSLSGNGLDDIFVASYTTNSNYEWAFNFGGTTNDNALDLLVKNNSLFLGGYYSGSSDFSSSSIPYSINSTGFLTGFLAKYSLLPPPAIFTIIGGGNYCQGGIGLLVELDGSEIGVDYQLQLNGANVGSPVAGTGNSISFGNQTSIGTYTVTASNGSMPTTMQGSVDITLGSSATVDQVPNISVCNGEQVPITTFSSPDWVTYEWANSDPSIGVVANGIGNLPAFTATNNTNTPITATVTVTPNAVPSRFHIIGKNSSTFPGFNTSNNQKTLGTGTNNADMTGISVSSDNRHIYITHNFFNTVSVYETHTQANIAVISVGNQPAGIAVSPDNLKVYVANMNSNSVSVIDAVTNTVVNTIVVGNRPYGVAFSPNGNFAYVTNINSATTSVIDVATETVIATVPVGSFPRGVVVSPDNNYIYVANLGSDNVSVIDATNNQVITTVGVGDGPYGIAINTTGSQVYVSNGNSSPSNPPTISFIDCDVNNNIFVHNTSVQVGTSPQGISVDPVTGLLYVAHYYPARVTIIDPPTASIVSSFTNNLPYEPTSFGNFIGTSQTNCPGTPMTFDISVSPTPSAFNVTGEGPYCIGNPVTLGLDDSDIGINYQVYLNGNTVNSPVSGTGNPISFGTFTIAGTYDIIAENASGCQTIVNAVIEDCYCPIIWTQFINTQVNGSTLEKVSGNNNNFNGAARSTGTLVAGTNGWTSSEVLETNKMRVFGLAQLNNSATFNAIDYAIRLRDNGKIQVLENGTLKGTFGNYATGDIIKIERIGTTIQYFHNANLIYTSTIASTTDLVADASIREIGGTIHNVLVSFGCVNPCATFVINIDAQTDETCLGANDGTIDLSTNSTRITWTWADNSTLNTGNRINLAPGTYNVTATDVNGCTTNASIIINPASNNCTVYVHGTTTLDCDANFFCHSIDAQIAVPNGIEGISFCVNYNPDIIEPTGNVILGNVVLNGGTGGYSIAVTTPGTVQIGVHYTSSAGSYLTGTGNILCVEFRVKHTDLLATGSYPITDCGVIETYNPSINPTIDVFTNADNGALALNGSTADIMNGRLTYRDATNNPIINTGTANIYAKIYANNSSCNNPPAGSIQPISPNSPSTQWGYFQLPMYGEQNVEVVRDLNPTTMVMDVINGADAVLTWQIAAGIHDADIFELISADVNGSGIVTPGDMTWIYQRDG